MRRAKSAVMAIEREREREREEGQRRTFDAGVICESTSRTVWIKKLAADFSLPLLSYAEVQGHPLRDGLRLEALSTLGRQHVGLEGLERGEA